MDKLRKVVNVKMSEQMEFPETFEQFAKEYGFKDNKEVYTNGLDLIPIYRVKQWLEHEKENLQPCPFCGSINVKIYNKYASSEYVKCNNCGVTTVADEREKVIRLWNARCFI